MKTQIINLNSKSSNEKERLSFFMSKCIMLGYFLPYSFVQLLDLIAIYGSTLTRQEMASLAVKKKIVFSEQVVLNYFCTLKNFGLVTQPKRGFLELASVFDKKN